MNTKLPEEVEIYRNRMNAFYCHKTVPRKIAFKWSSEIETSNLCGMEEEGAYFYLKGRNLSEENLIYFAMQAETIGYLDMANGFWKRAYLKSKSPNKLPSLKKNRKKLNESQAQEVQEISKYAVNFHNFWLSLLKEQRKYSCYAIFFAFPTDKEAIKYLSEYSSDLQIFSNSGTLVATTGSDEYLRVNVDGKILSVEIKGYAKLTHLFGVDFTVNPCVVFFENMNSSKEVLFTFKGMTAEEISETMRAAFSIIERSVREKKSPVLELQKHRNSEQLRYLGKTVTGGASNFLKHTYTTIIQELTKIYAPKSGNN